MDVAQVIELGRESLMIAVTVSYTHLTLPTSR